jgi:hypothetical protein
VTLPKTVIGTHSDPLLKDYNSSATAGALGAAAKGDGIPENPVTH